VCIDRCVSVILWLCSNVTQLNCKLYSIYDYMKEKGPPKGKTDPSLF
jgi:hypothetical protein